MSSTPRGHGLLPEDQTPGSVPVFRVFISSTFADLEDERAALHDSVFPELGRLCAALGAHFQAIDLRWGVTTEAARDQRAVSICLEEIDRCRAATPRPYFVLLLGNRYGWCPPPETVAAADFERLRARMTPEDVVLVDQWYDEDRNAVPSQYRLRPRRPGDDDQVWPDVERRLRDALRRAARTETANAPGSSEALHLESSVTELEVDRALSRSDPPLPGAVHAFFRTITGLPADRSVGVYAESPNGTPDGSGAAVQRLRARVRDHLGSDQVLEYSVGWDAAAARPTRDHLVALSRDVRAALESTIRTELGLRTKAATWHQENRDHEAFGRERSAAFAGRGNVLADLAGRASGPFAPPLLVVGAAGSGKTAVLAELVRRLRSGSLRNVVVRFIGATPGSVQVRSLVQDLTAVLREQRGAETAHPPLGADAAVEAFRKELTELRDPEGTVLVIDGLDQLAGDPVDLGWLPAAATPGVQLVLSAQTGPVAAALVRFLETTPLPLEPMPVEEGTQLLASWLSAAGRDLQPDQRAEVLRAFRPLGLPLHLRLAFQEARRWSSSTVIPTGYLADDVDGMIGQLLDRLQREHGEHLVPAALGYLAAARNGLTEDEELDLLSANTEVDQEVSERFPRSPAIRGRVPPVLWARLYSDLQPYVVERPADGRVLLGFFHRQMADGIRSRYLAGDTAQVRHRELARYFAEQPLRLSGPSGAEAPNLRKLSELPYQQAHGGLSTQLYATLTDFRFLEAKIRWSDVEMGTDETGNPLETHYGVYGLQDDLDHALELWPVATASTDRRRDVLSALQRAVSLESDVLTVRPALAWQQLANRLQRGRGELADLLLSETDRRQAAGQTWLRLRSRFSESSALLRRLNPRSDQLSACALTPKGDLAVSTGMDGTVRVWNPASGRAVRVLREAGIPVTCAVTPDGRFAVAAGGDGALRVWRITDGQMVAHVPAHQSSVNACAVLPDGRHTVTFGADGAVRSWRLPDLRAGDLLADDAGHVTFGAVSVDGTIVAYGNRESSHVELRSVQRDGPAPLLLDAGSPVVSCAFGATPSVLLTGHTDGTLSTWILPTGRERNVQAHDGEVLDCAVTPDGALAATAGADGDVKLWRLPDLAPIATLRGHQWMVTSCAFSADGGLLISVGGDGTACLWDTRTARAAQQDGHTQLVESCAFTPDGGTLLTASTDGTLRRWSASTGSEQRAAVRHPGSTVLMARYGESVVLAAGDDGTVILMPEPGSSPLTIGHHGALVWSLAVLPDGSSAVTAGDDGACRVWDLDTGEQRLVFPGDGAPVRSCAVNPSGTRVASAGDAGIVHLWELASGSSVQLTGHTAPIWSVSIGPQEWVAAGAKDGSVRLWRDHAARTVGETLGQHGNSAEHLLWIGSERLISAAVDGTIAVWPVNEACTPLRWSAHRGPVRGITAAPAGEVLVSVGADGLLAVWARADGSLLASIPFTGQLRAVTAHPTEPVVAATGDGGLVHIAELVGWHEDW